MRPLLLLLATTVLAEDARLYAIREGRKIGFIDIKGKVVVEPRFDAAGEFSEGMARISTGALSGYINAFGKVVVEPQYTVAHEFQNGVAVVSQESKYALIDKTGKRIAEIPYRVMGDFHSGLLRVIRDRWKDPDGTVFQSVYGYIDLKGRVAIKPQFSNASDFPDDGDGLAIAYVDKEWCYIDRQGAKVFCAPLENDRAMSFHNGLVRSKKDGWWGYRDAQGKWAIEAKYDQAEDFKDGRTRVMLENKWIWIDKRGSRLVNEPKYYQLKPYAEGFAVANVEGRTTYVDQSGAIPFRLPIVQEAHSFSCGLARIKLDGRYGFLDKTGAFAIKPTYSDASDFRGCLASVYFEDRTYGYIDIKGGTVWKSAPFR